MQARPVLGKQRVNPTWLRVLKVLAKATVFSPAYLRLGVEGVENIPPAGACLLASNHVSAIDPFLIGFVINRSIYYVGKIELFRNPLIAWLFKSVGAIPTDRDALDITSVRTIMQLLREQQLVGIAPEGTRSRTGEMLPFVHGAAKLAIHTKTPIVPAAIYGSRQVMPPGAGFWKPGKIYITFGERFDFSEFYSRPITPEVLDKATGHLRERVVDLYEQIRGRPLK